MAEDWVEVGVLGAPHGIRGELRFFAHNAESPLFAKAPLQGVRLRLDGAVRSTRITEIRPTARCFIVRVDGVNSRPDAQALTHAAVEVPASLFAPADTDEDEYSVFELEGLAVLHPGSDRRAGTLRTIVNHGAGDILVIDTEDGERLVPFAEPWVGAISLEQRTIEVDVDAWNLG